MPQVSIRVVRKRGLHFLCGLRVVHSTDLAAPTVERLAEHREDPHDILLHAADARRPALFEFRFLAKQEHLIDVFMTDASSLHEAGIFFLLTTTTLFVWYGRFATFKQRRQALKFAEGAIKDEPRLSALNINHVQQYDEPANFWLPFGGEGEVSEPLARRIGAVQAAMPRPHNALPDPQVAFPRVAIIGAGVAGQSSLFVLVLSHAEGAVCARELLASGYRVVVFEARGQSFSHADDAEDRAGGQVLTKDFEGCSFNVGSPFVNGNTDIFREEVLS